MIINSFNYISSVVVVLFSGDCFLLFSLVLKTKLLTPVERRRKERRREEKRGEERRSYFNQLRQIHITTISCQLRA